MDVQKYIFQSPYSSSVQVGRPDPSSKQENSSQDTSANLAASTNQTLQNAQDFKTSQTSEVKATVESNQLLDVYA